MTFYLGTHEPAWLGRAGVPLFVSARRLRRGRTTDAPGRRRPAAAAWCLDSGGFTELNLYGTWQTTPEQYAAEARGWAAQIGRMAWAAPQDWMCEPVVREKTGRTVREHQELTVANYLHLRRIAPDVPFIPVLQGWEPADYAACVRLYEAAGVDLPALPVVGLGTVCRRQGTKEAARIVADMHGRGIKLHGFGFKLTGIKAVGHLMASADSLAWSYAATKRPRLDGCTHQRCQNCLKFALAWRAAMLDRLGRPDPGPEPI